MPQSIQGAASVTRRFLYRSLAVLVVLGSSASMLISQQSPFAPPKQPKTQDRVSLTLIGLGLKYINVASYSPENGIGKHDEIQRTLPPGIATGGACVFGTPHELGKNVEPETIIAKLKANGVTAEIDEAKTLIPFAGEPSYVINFSYPVGHGRIFITSNTTLLTSEHWLDREFAVVYDKIEDQQHH
jgi:hypothetical protein